MLLFDLNLKFYKCHTSLLLFKEMAYECWENSIFTIDGVPPPIRISKMCRALPRRLQDQVFFLLGSIPLYGFCPTYLSRKPPRHSSLPPGQPTKTLSYGLSRKRVSQYLGSRQPSPRLVHLRRLRSNLDCPGPNSLRQRRLWYRAETNNLCLRRYHHRPLSVSFPLGSIPPTKRSHQAPYPDGFTRQHSYADFRHSWQSPRSQSPRRPHYRTRSTLHSRPRLS